MTGLPPEDIHATLRPTAGSSFCEWHGVARHFDVAAGRTSATRAACRHGAPLPRFAPLAGFIAFYSGLMDEGRVGAARVLPQPGAVYGGRVTADLEGIVEGAPGRALVSG